MRVRKYQMRDMDNLINMWNEAFDTPNQVPGKEKIDPMSGDAFFRSAKYCGVAVDFGANIHGFYVLLPLQDESVCMGAYAFPQELSDPGVVTDLINDSISAAGREGYKTLRVCALKDGFVSPEKCAEMGFGVVKESEDIVLLSRGLA